MDLLTPLDGERNRARRNYREGREYTEVGVGLQAGRTLVAQRRPYEVLRSARQRRADTVGAA